MVEAAVVLVVVLALQLHDRAFQRASPTPLVRLLLPPSYIALNDSTQLADQHSASTLARAHHATMTNGSSIKLLTGESGRLCDSVSEQASGLAPIACLGWTHHKRQASGSLHYPTLTACTCSAQPGNSHPELAQAVASRLGIPLCQSTVKKFSDNETSVQIGESVREEDVYIIQVC